MLVGTICGKPLGEDMFRYRHAQQHFALFFDGATTRLAFPGVVLAVVVAPMLHMSGTRCAALVHEFFKLRFCAARACLQNLDVFALGNSHFFKLCQVLSE